MIEIYFDSIEKAIRDFPYISSYTLNKKIYSRTQGFIRGEVIFENGSLLEFIEVKAIEVKEKLKYRYHFMDKDKYLVFRYDNACHHKHLKTYPHHKHVSDNKNVKESTEPNLGNVLLEIFKSKFKKQM